MSNKNKPLARFVQGSTIMSKNFKDYYLFDKSEKYLSMIQFNPEDCVDGETIIEIEWGNGGQGVKIVSFIPDNIEGYEKMVQSK